MPSTVVSAIHYYPSTSTLRIIFVSGMIYDYKNVPEKVYKALKSSSSKGAYLNQHIKGLYDFEKVK
jgi:KTSC domain